MLYIRASCVRRSCNRWTPPPDWSVVDAVGSWMLAGVHALAYRVCVLSRISCSTLCGLV